MPEWGCLIMNSLWTRTQSIPAIPQSVLATFGICHYDQWSAFEEGPPDAADSRLLPFFVMPSDTECALKRNTKSVYLQSINFLGSPLQSALLLLLALFKHHQLGLQLINFLIVLSFSEFQILQPLIGYLYNALICHSLLCESSVCIPYPQCFVDFINLATGLSLQHIPWQMIMIYGLQQENTQPCQRIGTVGAAAECFGSVGDGRQSIPRPC